MDIYFLITDSCNLHCDFCIRKNLDTNISCSLTAIQFDKASVKLKSLFPNSAIVLSGGEPSLHAQFEDILHISAEHFSRVVVNSNGNMEYDKIECISRFLGKDVYLQLSIDGPQEIHDSIRGNGSYERCMHTLDILSDYASHISISTTVRKDTIDKLFWIP